MNPDHFFQFFELAALASYRAQPDKYEVQTDSFNGELKLTACYRQALTDAQHELERLRLRFGYRTKHGGEVAIAVFSPDLRNCAPDHIDRLYGVPEIDVMPDY